MQKEDLTVAISLNSPCICIPYGTKTPGSQQDDDRGNDFLLESDDQYSTNISGKIRILPSVLSEINGPDNASNSNTVFEIRQIEVSYSCLTVLPKYYSEEGTALNIGVGAQGASTVSPDRNNYTRQNSTSAPGSTSSAGSAESISASFKLKVPGWVPPSLNTSHCKVMHVIQARVKYSTNHKSVSHFILGRSHSHILAAHTEFNIRTATPLSLNPTSRLLYESAASEKDFTWKVKCPYSVKKGSQIPVLLKFKILPPVSGNLAIESISMDLMQERIKYFYIDSSSAWSFIPGRTLYPINPLDCGLKRPNEKSREYPILPHVVTYDPSPPPAPDLYNPNSLVEINYGLQVRLALRDARKLLPSCYTPFIKIRHRVRISVKILSLSSNKRETYTLSVPIVVTNEESTAGRDDLLDSDIHTSTERLPTYDDVLSENLTVSLWGPTTKHVGSGSPTQTPEEEETIVLES
ncbi:hypothetical protein V1511DRAFT_461313 [Dipodascopsis uninucleata]